MFRTRSKKIMGDVWARKGRTLLVSAAIFVGVAGTIALFTMSDALISQLETQIEEGRISMAQVTVNARSDTRLDHVADLDRLAAVPGVTSVMGGVESQPVYFKLRPDTDDFEKGHIQAYAISNKAGELISVFGDNAPMEPLQLMVGTFPRAGANEIVIEHRLAEAYDLAINDPLYFRVLSPSRLPDRAGETGTLEQWTITGLVFDAYAGMDNPQQAVFARFDDATYLVGLAGFTEFWFRFDDYATAEAEIEGIVTTIADDLPYMPITSTTEDPANSFLMDGARITGSVMSALAITALVVSGFLVINVISAIILEQKRQIGVMKALGASPVDHIMIYTGIALFYGMLGVIPGIIVGIPAGNAMAHGIGPEMNVMLSGFQYSPTSIGLGILMGLLVPVIASLPPVLNGTRVNILDAMTDLGINAQYGRGVLAQVIKLLPLPSTIHQGLSNIVRKKARMAFTIVTLAVAVGAFMGIFSGFSQLARTLDVLGASYRAEIALMPAEPRDPAAIHAIISDHFADEIATVESGYQIAVSFDGYDPALVAGSTGEIFAYGYDTMGNHPAFSLSLDRGSFITPETIDTGIIVSNKLADSMGRSVGDRVTMKASGQSGEFEIVGIARYPFDQVWLHWATLATLTTGQTSDTPDTAIHPQAYYLQTTQTDLDAEAVDDLISGLSDKLAAAGIPVGSVNYVQTVDDITETYTSFQVIFQAVALLIALVGALGLLITLSMNVFERQKEIGVMRSIGATSAAIAAQFITEGIVVGVLSWLVGLPIMIGIELMLIEITGFEGVLSAEITPAAILIGLTGVAVLTFFASLIPALSAARKTVSDILRYA